MSFGPVFDDFGGGKGVMLGRDLSEVRLKKVNVLQVYKK
jgi:hypothetical protein